MITSAGCPVCCACCQALRMVVTVDHATTLLLRNQPTGLLPPTGQLLFHPTLDGVASDHAAQHAGWLGVMAPDRLVERVNVFEDDGAVRQQGGLGLGTLKEAPFEA
jgi:hypothetical protein